MPFDRFLIAPINSGLQLDLKPFMIADDAFEQLDNAYVFRGRVRKRFGAQPLNTNVAAEVQQQYTRLRLSLGVINPATHSLAGNVPGTIFGLGQAFSIGIENYYVNDGTAGLHNLLHNSIAVTATYNNTNGAFNFIFPDATFDNVAVYFYPAQPVMGITNYETNNLNKNPTIAFDTQFSYIFSGTSWQRLGAASWTGNDLNFFWSCNWHNQNDYTNALFVTNYNAADEIKYYDGANWTTLTNLRIGPTNVTNWFLKTCKVLVVFKNRLIAFNTVEDNGGAQTYVNRARFSRNGNPIDVNESWLAAPGRGGWIDAPTKEEIITAQLLKDRLIVYFESSTWELVYTGNELLPFRWQNINSELGADSTFSQIPFDKVVLGIGNVGIMACNGAHVERIDEKIPDEVYKMHQNNDGPLRIAGIRDFYVEMVYWAFPSNQGYIDAVGPVYPNKILVYNYRTSSWALNDDAITAFGYFRQQNALTWATEETWGGLTDTWGTGQLAANPLKIIAGNQEGFTFIIDVDNVKNSISLQVTDIDEATATITVVNHTLADGSWVQIEHCNGVVFSDGEDVQSIFQIRNSTTNTFILDGCVIDGDYTGGGIISRVSQINIKTKQFNLYLDKGRNTYIEKVDFLVNREPQHYDANNNPIPSAQVTVECYPSYSDVPLCEYGRMTGSILGVNVLELTPYLNVPLEANQSQFWHTLYFQAEGEAIQFNIRLDPEEMQNPNISLNDFQLNAFMIYAMPTSSRLE